MRLMIYVGDEGPTDLDFKDGDVFAVQPDSWVPGNEEAKKWLNIQVPDYGGQRSELVESEYANGPSSNGPSPVRHMRKYFVPYWAILTQAEIAAVRDKTTPKAVIVDRFDLTDIVRK